MNTICDVRTHQNSESALKHYCNGMFRGAGEDGTRSVCSRRCHASVHAAREVPRAAKEFAWTKGPLLSGGYYKVNTGDPGGSDVRPLQREVTSDLIIRQPKRKVRFGMLGCLGSLIRKNLRSQRTKIKHLNDKRAGFSSIVGPNQLTNVWRIGTVHEEFNLPSSFCRHFTQI